MKDKIDVRSGGWSKNQRSRIEMKSNGVLKLRQRWERVWRVGDIFREGFRVELGEDI